MRRCIEEMTFPKAKSNFIEGPDDDPGPAVFVERNEPIKITDRDVVYILTECAFLALKWYPDGNIPDKHRAVFCPQCATLMGVANAYEVLVGEMHVDGRRHGRGTKVRILGQPVCIACDEPECSGELYWPPEKVNWSPWLNPSQIAQKLSISVKTLNRMIGDGLIRAERRHTKLLRIVLDGLPGNWRD